MTYVTNLSLSAESQKSKVMVESEISAIICCGLAHQRETPAGNPRDREKRNITFEKVKAFVSEEYHEEVLVLIEDLDLIIF